MKRQMLDMKKLLEDEFDNNRKACAQTFKISEATLCRVLNGRNNAGGKLLTSIIKYCSEKGIDFNKYIKI